MDLLAQQISATLANTSRYLQILASAGLVTRRVDGTSRVYRLADRAVETGYRVLVDLAEQHIAEVTAVADAFFQQCDGTRPVTFSEFDEMSRTGQVVLVDVRPSSEFAAGHVEGAVNIPVESLATRMTELPPDVNVVAYCRGPYCVMAATAVTHLRAAGYQAVRLDGGYPQWRDAGRVVA